MQRIARSSKTTTVFMVLYIRVLHTSAEAQNQYQNEYLTIHSPFITKSIKHILSGI